MRSGDNHRWQHASVRRAAHVVPIGIPSVPVSGPEFVSNLKPLHPSDFQGFPLQASLFANGLAQPWIMHPGEHLFPPIGSLPVSSFSSSRGSPDSSDYGSGATSSADFPVNEMYPGRDGMLSDQELKLRVQLQIEYYFSPSNLPRDGYLKSQMDQDHYVPVALIANFNCVRRLTLDKALITEAIRMSSKLELDDSEQRVRPKSNRSTVVIHDLPETVKKEDLEELFLKLTTVRPVNYECADRTCWYVEFDEEAEAKEALRYLREDVRDFCGKPICTRIRAIPVAGSVNAFKNVDSSYSMPASGPYHPVISPESQEKDETNLIHPLQPTEETAHDRPCCRRNLIWRIHSDKESAPMMNDDSVPLVNRSPGDMLPAHAYPAYNAFPNPNAPYFAPPAAVAHGVNPSLLVWPPMPGVTYFDMMNLVTHGMYNPMQPPQQQQPPQTGQQMYRGPPPGNRGGIRGRGRGMGGNSNYDYRNNNRRGRGGSNPNSGRNSAMSETRSDYGTTGAGNPQRQHSRHGSFSSVNGYHDAATPTSVRSGSDTPPVQPEIRDSDVGLEDRRNSFPNSRKPKRTVSENQNQTEEPQAFLVHAQPHVAKEVPVKFDLESTMFPPLPGGHPAEPMVNGEKGHHITQTHQVNMSDVVRGVTSPRPGQASVRSYVDGEGAMDGFEHRKNYSLDNSSGPRPQVIPDKSHKKEQSSSTDDLPKSGREHSTDARLRTNTTDRTLKANSSAGTQTSTSGTDAASHNSARTQHVAAQTSPSARSTSRPTSSPKNTSPRKDSVQSAAAGDTGPIHNAESISKTSLPTQKSADESSAAGSVDAAKSQPADQGKASTFSYARVAQLNRDKLIPPVSASSSGSSTGSRGSPLTKQVSVDGSNQSQEDGRSLKQEPIRSQSGNSRGELYNGHENDHAYSNGHAETEEPEDLEGFTEVTKHKPVRHSDRHRGAAGPRF